MTDREKRGGGAHYFCWHVPIHMIQELRIQFPNMDPPLPTRRARRQPTSPETGKARLLNAFVLTAQRMQILDT